jgi:acetylornithine deacetylase/succinyl-diaminopimelate desuccinylase-like protein
MYISMHSQLVHTLRKKGANTHTHTHTHTHTVGVREGGRGPLHRFGWSNDFSSGPFLQHAADERIRLEELRKKVKLFCCLNLWT